MHAETHTLRLMYARDPSGALCPRVQKSDSNTGGILTRIGEKPDSPLRTPFGCATGRANQVRLGQGFIQSQCPPHRVRGLFTCGRKGRARVLGALRARTDIRMRHESFNGVRGNHGVAPGERCAGGCAVTRVKPAVSPLAGNPGGAILSITDSDKLEFAYKPLSRLHRITMGLGTGPKGFRKAVRCPRIPQA